MGDLNLWLSVGGFISEGLWMSPGSIRTELLAPPYWAILRTNHARGIWDLSWLSTLGGVNWSQSVGVLREIVCVCGVEGSISSSDLGCLMYLSPVGLWLSISIVLVDPGTIPQTKDHTSKPLCPSLKHFIFSFVLILQINQGTKHQVLDIMVIITSCVIKTTD